MFFIFIFIEYIFKKYNFQVSICFEIQLPYISIQLKGIIYMKSKVGLRRGIVELKSHDSYWEEAFLNEKKILKKVLFQYNVIVDHVGSTAVKTISAKPVIDILIRIKSKFNESDIIKLLQTNGYDYRENAGDGSMLFFAKGSSEKRTHYIHISSFGNREAENMIFFRDTLSNNKEIAERYNSVKKNLEEKYSDDRNSYTKGKSEFVNRVLSKKIVRG